MVYLLCTFPVSGYLRVPYRPVWSVLSPATALKGGLWRAISFQPLTQQHQEVTKVARHSATLLGQTALLIPPCLTEQAAMFRYVLNCLGMCSHGGFGC
jgi:hypothetical protein